jgi:flavin reductase (DIM6/NTAB) family NADH-FMN oxidoreductase RutF
MKKFKIFMIFLATFLSVSIQASIHPGSAFSLEVKPDSEPSLYHASNPEALNGQTAEMKKKSLGARTVLPSPVWVIGSYDKNGQANAMTSSWAAICCSRPPCVTISLRKETYTYGNIMEKKAFTVNIPAASQAAYAAYFGSVSGRDVNKFVATGLTPVKSDLVEAPYIKEFPLILECRLRQTLEIGSHTMFIGEIVDVKADENILTEEGTIDLEKFRGFFFQPGRGKFYQYGEFLGDVAALAEKIKAKK